MPRATRNIKKQEDKPIPIATKVTKKKKEIIHESSSSDDDDSEIEEECKQPKYMVNRITPYVVKKKKDLNSTIDKMIEDGILILAW